MRSKIKRVVRWIFWVRNGTGDSNANIWSHRNKLAPRWIFGMIGEISKLRSICVRLIIYMTETYQRVFQEKFTSISRMQVSWKMMFCTDLNI